MAPVFLHVAACIVSDRWWLLRVPINTWYGHTGLRDATEDFSHSPTVLPVVTVLRYAATRMYVTYTSPN